MLCLLGAPASASPDAVPFPSPSPADYTVDLHSHHSRHHKKEHHEHHEHHEHKDRPQAYGAAGHVYGVGNGSAACTADGCWPRMFIIGAQKSGTTSLFDQMEHQGACGGGASLKDKEAHFFDDTWPASQHQYTKHFGGMGKGCPHRLYVDATPNYIRHWYAPERMSSLIPAEHRASVRMVVLLREPVARDLSYYNHQLGNHLDPKRKHHQPISSGLGEKRMSACAPAWLSSASEEGSIPGYHNYVECEIAIWQKCVAASGGGGMHAAYEKCQGQGGSYQASGGDTGMTFLSSGMYSAQLNRWKTFWPRNQMLVVQMEALLDNTGAFMHAIYTHLGFPAPIPGKLPDRNEKDFKFTVHTVPCSTKKTLKEIYEPWNEELVGLLAQDHASGAAPSIEPAFPAFPDLVHCKTTAEGDSDTGGAAGGDTSLLASEAAPRALQMPGAS